MAPKMKGFVPAQHPIKARSAAHLQKFVQLSQLIILHAELGEDPDGIGHNRDAVGLYSPAGGVTEARQLLKTGVASKAGRCETATKRCASQGPAAGRP